MGTVEKLLVKKYSGPNIGGTVYLNSGSPPLTLTYVVERETGYVVGVTWISDDGQLQQAEFPVECVCVEPPLSR
jgi:hypothetical protein